MNVYSQWRACSARPGITGAARRADKGGKGGVRARNGRHAPRQSGRLHLAGDAYGNTSPPRTSSSATSRVLCPRRNDSWKAPHGRSRGGGEDRPRCLVLWGSLYFRQGGRRRSARLVPRVVGVLSDLGAALFMRLHRRFARRQKPKCTSDGLARIRVGSGCTSPRLLIEHWFHPPSTSSRSVRGFH